MKKNIIMIIKINNDYKPKYLYNKYIIYNIYYV